MPKDDDAERVANSASSLYRYSGVGLTFAVSILLFAGLGWWLDERLGTSPWLLLVGVFTGFPLALYSLVRKFAPRPPASQGPASPEDRSSRRPPPSQR
ncbi:MAG: AtpZ/AtpI family protein [Planctomycetota bacterium]